MSELKAKLKKAINNIDFDNLSESQKMSLENALAILKVDWDKFNEIVKIKKETTHWSYLPNVPISKEVEV